MEFYAYHGCYEAERVIGSRFVVNLEIVTDLEKSALSDNIDDTLNYQTAWELVKEQMDLKSNLLENVAGRIIAALYEKFSFISKATVKVSKMNPPMGGQIEKVSVKLSR